MIQAIVALLSFAVLFFYLDGRRWRGFTVAANERRKRIEEESKAEIARLDYELACHHHAYAARGDVLKSLGQLRQRALEKIAELNREASVREDISANHRRMALAALDEKQKTIVDLRGALNASRESVALLETVHGESCGALVKANGRILDLERELVMKKRGFDIEAATVKAMRRELDVRQSKIENQDLKLLGARNDIETLLERIRERSRALDKSSKKLRRTRKAA